jgi:hypothetical protein
VIARLWRDKRLRREAGGVRGLCAQTGVAGYLRTPAAGAAYILTRQLDDGLGELFAFSL